MTWKLFIKDYFNFSRTERFGIIALCVCIFVTLSVKCTMPYWLKPRTDDATAFLYEIAQFRQTISLSAIEFEQTEIATFAQADYELFYFDPNKVNNDEFERLGFNERQIKNIRNYQASGGTFRRKEDLQKLYTISATQYQRIEPYIRISVGETTKKQTSSTFSASKNFEKTESVASRPQKNTTTMIELNLADSALLTQLPGIGPVLAARTVKYRNNMGGFVNIEQLGEVYGVSSELVERLSSLLTADSALITKIPVNTALLNELTKHPYINQQQARAILYYRQMQKRINNIDELVRNNILTREAAETIRPYLSFE